MKNIRLQVRIPEDLHARLTDIAKQRDQPLNTVIVKSIQAGVGDNRTTDEAIIDMEKELAKIRARLDALEK